jgi:hypothetical protein
MMRRNSRTHKELRDFRGPGRELRRASLFAVFPHRESAGENLALTSDGDEALSVTPRGNPFIVTYFGR